MNGISPEGMRHSAQFATQQHGWLAKLSLEHKLPLIIATLLVAVIATISTAAYVEMRSTSVRVASERLLNVTGQFRDLFQQSTTQLRVANAAAARGEAVVRFARTRNERDRAAAVAQLRTAAQPEQVVATELRNAEGSVVLSTHPERNVGGLATNDVLPRVEPGDSASIGAFRSWRDTTVYAVASAVRGSDDLYVVRWRRLAGTQRTRETLTRLVGSDAAIFLGNADASHWSDLERPVAGLPAVTQGARPTQSYRRGADSARHLAAAAVIPGTPWAVAIDFPMSAVLAPIGRFMRNVAILSAIALVLALGAGWLVSRRITRPLRDLTEAAGAVASGDFSRRVSIKRSDELGRLGRAFSTMASEVQQSRENLEHRVEQRTADLNKALTQLQDAQDTLVRKEKLALLGQLSSGVGHELRNPLGVMNNAVYYLRTVLAEQPATIHEYLAILQQQITLSEKIVSDLLDFARSKPPKRSSVRLADIVELQLARLGPLESVAIRNGVGPELPLVLVDQVQIGQVLLNLITNASQAMNGSGTITLRARENHNGIICEVIDTGPGVAAENIDKVFEPLFTTKARGIGLGLAVSRTLARANGGDLTVESAPGKGATFRLTLPGAASAPTVELSPAPAGAHV